MGETTHTLNKNHNTEQNWSLFSSTDPIAVTANVNNDHTYNSANHTATLVTEPTANKELFLFTMSI
jgi:hypothetical protein